MRNKTMLRYDSESELEGIDYQNSVLLRDTGKNSAEAILRTEAEKDGMTIFADEIRADADKKTVNKLMNNLRSFSEKGEIGSFNPDSVPTAIHNSGYDKPGEIDLPSLKSTKFLNTADGNTTNQLVVDEEYVDGEIRSEWEDGSENYFENMIGIKGLDNIYIGSNPLIEIIDYESLPPSSQDFARNLDFEPSEEKQRSTEEFITKLSDDSIEFEHDYIVMAGENGNMLTLTDPRKSEIETYIDSFNPSQVQYLNNGEVENYFEDEIDQLKENFSSREIIKESERTLPNESILYIIDQKENLRKVNDMIVSENRIEDAKFSIRGALGDK